MKVHFIAIGGSAMHNLAISLKIKGYEVTGSDDEIFEPSKSHLKKYNILPTDIGWNPDKITPDLDAVILGMHAREDNPELVKAKQLGLKIYSYPEYLYEQSKDKTRIVVGGSHGKTTITSMILHVLNACGIACDYMVGAQLEGFEVMVKLTENAPFMVIEGDEYLTSAIDRRPKFHLYRPYIGIVSGIAWDHINVFPTFDNYVEQFQIFADSIDEKGAFIYCKEDENCCRVADNCPIQRKIGYSVPAYKIVDRNYVIIDNGKEYPLQVFGRHNLMNINAARLACNQIGVTDADFYQAITTFKGASKRLELVEATDDFTMYKDFAHSPSKLKATIDAVREKFGDRDLVACLELHTFSSLTAEFLQQYAHCMDKADVPIVYFNPHTIAHKHLPPITEEMILDSFKNEKIKVYQDSSMLKDDLLKMKWKNKTLLMMSSGNFDGLDFKEIAQSILK